jgi:hypothetical protein
VGLGPEDAMLSRNLALVTLALAVVASPTTAQDLATTRYDIGTPDVTDVFVDPRNGDDDASGTSRAEALRTLDAAWRSIPAGAPLRRGVRIQLLPGEYAESAIPNYLESRYGTFEHPIVVQAAEGRGTALLRGDLNVFDVRYLYLVDVDVVPDPPGDAFHCEQCDHLLLRGVRLDGGASREAHETLKVNQSRHVYVEDCDISGADDNAIDFVAVQYGHIVRSRIHDANDWCAYVKGGSAYLVVDSNRIHDCGTGGFTAGQGTGLEFMTSPWIHYEAYDVKFTNNVVYRTDGAGVGINGGYDVLVAHNTLYRVGARSHLLEVVYGLRSCDGDAARCGALLSAGGWGTAATGTEGEPIGNRNVFVYANVVANPSGASSGDQHLAVYGPRSPSAGTNLARPQQTDTNLRIRGNLIWNGGPGFPLGVGDGEGCDASNATCNPAQLATDNAINEVEPSFRDPEAGDFRPAPGSALLGFVALPAPSFPVGDRPTRPLAAEGVLDNAVPRDRSGALRGPTAIVGAYDATDAALDPAGGGEGSGDTSPPTVRRVRCTPLDVAAGSAVTCKVRVEDASGVASVRIAVGPLERAMRRVPGTSLYRRRLVLGTPGTYVPTASALDRAGNEASAAARFAVNVAP